MSTASQMLQKVFTKSTISYAALDNTYYDTPENASFSVNSTGSVNSSASSNHTGFIDYYISKFDQMARGRLANKYHVAFYGPYVDQALLIMARNSAIDKYQSQQKKTFMGEQAANNMFKQWAKMFFNPNTSCLSMYWAASSVDITPATADVENAPIESIRGMSYPIVKGVKTGGENTVTITVVDDPYMMWYQFFNALFNTQFTPLVLKPTSTWQKINIAINEYSEMCTGSYSVTDLRIGQMFEFNSCVLKAAPQVKLGFDGNSSPVTYQISFAHPNAFQGTFKEKLRFKEDFTCRDRGAQAAWIKNSGGSKYGQMWTAYGSYNEGQFNYTPKDRPETYAAYRISDHINYDESAGFYPQSMNRIAETAHAKTTVGWNNLEWSLAK